MQYHLDYETRSACNLNKWGEYRYAEDPTTEVLMAAISVDKEEPVLWINPKFDIHRQSNPRALDLMCLARSNGSNIYAHNAQFEIAISQHHWPVHSYPYPPLLPQWRCTAAIARRAGLPSSLANLSTVLNLEHGKHAVGSKLIEKFCNPPFVEPKDAPEEWRTFCEYCLQDVRAEQEVHQKLRRFDFNEGMSHDTYELDKKINYRGMPVNIPALKKAQKLSKEIDKWIEVEFDILTDGLRVTQVAKLLPWFRERGYPGKNLQAETIETARLDTTWGDEWTRRALELREQNSFASLKKIPAMIGGACKDGRVRGTLTYHGARPGRWSARRVQPQNFKRPTIRRKHEAYKAICSGCSVEQLKPYGDPGEVLSSCIRHFIQPEPPLRFVSGDYANIEARLVVWIAGQEDVLDMFRRGEDAYIPMGSKIFGTPVHVLQEKKNAGIDTLERFVGKQAVLGCGYGMGWEKFSKTCAKYGRPISDKLAKKAIYTYREENYKVVDTWEALEKAARLSVSDGKPREVGKIKFTCGKTAGIPFMFIHLPSGRQIAYPWPRLDHDGKISYWGSGMFKVAESEILTGWGRNSLYGGKILENISQGIAADIMSHGACAAENYGFEICALIHDEALAPFDGERTVAEFEACLSSLPDWAVGLPLKVDAKCTDYYTK